MFKITVDLGLCESYANCVIAAPEYFDLDDESGLVEILEENVTEERRAHVEDAVRSCPVAALMLNRASE